ncbi:OmpA family protein [Hippea alviniae]|uniref:OmpA family protein n=1 Tax=Hippea alviniae TaxID=1279027 RepID=UPI0003B4C03B|nr:OmpA family protein [Hippea alviniae]
MKRLLVVVIAVVVSMALYNCSSTKYIQNTRPQNQSNMENQQIKTSTLKYPSINVESGKNIQILKKEFETIAKDIHFKFNSYELTPIHEYGINENPTKILDKIANFMLKHPKIKIRIEGNCDERGTIEYNLALGEKRALAAKQYLVSKGVSPDRITIISYGKSRPLDPAHNEYAWAKNRRDHFVFIEK